MERAIQVTNSRNVGINMTGSGSNRIDVVVVSHGRNSSLIRLLRSFCNSPETTEMIGKFILVIDSKPLPDFTGFCMEHKLDVIAPETRIFITNAKNVGWHECTSDLILFVDDDNIIDDSSVLHLVNLMNSDSSIGAMMPSVSYYGKRNLIWVYAPVFRPGKWRMNLIGRNTLEDHPPPSDLMEVDALPNAFIVRRSVLKEAGGFDSTFVSNNSCDLCQRIKALGYRTLASTKSRFYHDVSDPGKPGYWAEHASVDRERSFLESRDWILLMRRLHPGIRFWNPLLVWYFLLWVSQVSVGLVLLGSGPRTILGNLYAYSTGFINAWKCCNPGSINSAYAIHNRHL